ncbi:hypothetical protein [Shrimp hemocyte iridescent virus]|uniref:Uncharacterized protein n=2 Tax=Decapodiridovirus litopenaeus1 TaxID=3428192 RepID=A0A291B0M9_9VIRU|nr:hypothetical protein KM509_gp032 [Shrimp hemocyte iridescent virus]ATE87041.1 hypothetical protein [Shrimp hemocyte iridescent virus]
MESDPFVKKMGMMTVLKDLISEIETKWHDFRTDMGQMNDDFEILIDTFEHKESFDHIKALLKKDKRKMIEIVAGMHCDFNRFKDLLFYLKDSKYTSDKKELVEMFTQLNSNINSLIGSMYNLDDLLGLLPVDSY